MAFGFVGEEYYRNLCIGYLLRMLAGHQPFIDALQQLKESHSAISGYTWERINSLISATVPPPARELQEWEDIKRYHDALLSLINEYGLNPDWAREMVHNGVSNLDALGIGTGYEVPVEPRQYTIMWRPEAFWNKTQAKLNVLDQFEKKWTEYEHEWESAGFQRRRRRGALEDHIRWVFKRVCLKKSWLQIATDEHFNDDTIRHSVVPVIKLLGLQSPHIPGGRPRK